jgi:ribosomal protein S18 acetylase RimI-like enzyme
VESGDEGSPQIESLAWATDIDVLPVGHRAERRPEYVVVRSPSNPHHYWGNWLLFDGPPAAGDGVRWEQRFEAEFGGDTQVVHRAFGWDCIDGSLGAAETEFLRRGYELERTVGLVAAPDELQPHARQNQEVKVRMLDPGPAADHEHWEQVARLQVANRDPREDAAAHEVFTRTRLEDLRALFRQERGGWYVALLPGTDEVVASLGIVVTRGRGRFQLVDTAAAHRRRGICSRLVVEAAHHAARHWRIRRLVIAADPDYHALGLYESLGFRPREHVAGVLRRPAA